MVISSPVDGPATVPSSSGRFGRRSCEPASWVCCHTSIAKIDPSGPAAYRQKRRPLLTRGLVRRVSERCFREPLALSMRSWHTLSQTVPRLDASRTMRPNRFSLDETLTERCSSWRGSPSTCECCCAWWRSTVPSPRIRCVKSSLGNCCAQCDVLAAPFAGNSVFERTPLREQSRFEGQPTVCERLVCSP